MSKQRIPYKKVVVKSVKGAYLERFDKAIDLADKIRCTHQSVIQHAKFLMEHDNGN